MSKRQLPESYSQCINRASYFLMTARLPLRCLRFEHSRPLNSQHVSHLERIFERKFSPENEENRIPAIIQVEDLQSTWFIEADSDTQFPMLRPPDGHVIECLHGNHRVQAAKALFGPESTWVIDLYSAEMSENTKKEFFESYSCEKKPEGGEIFFKLRKYQRLREPCDRILARWWKACCTPKQYEYIHRLQGCRHQGILSALEKLTALRALHSGLKLGSTGRLLALGCEEEIIHAIDKVAEFWHFVFDDDEKSMQKLSNSSLEKLKWQAPGANELQRVELLAQAKTGALFGEFSEDAREKYMQRIIEKTVNTCVLTLDMIFDNLIVLERVVRNIKPLVPSWKTCSIRTALRHGYKPPNHDFGVETGRFHWIEIEPMKLQGFPCENDRFEMVLRQIWLCAFRLLESKPPAEKARTPGSESEIGNPCALQQFALLAKKIGIQTSAVKRLSEDDPNLPVALHILRMSLKPGYSHTENKLLPLAMKLAQSIRSARYEADTMCFEDYDSAIWTKKHGFGMPGKQNFQRDYPRIFLPQMHRERLYENQRSMSSFFMTRSLYYLLLGDNVKLGAPSTAITACDVADGANLDVNGDNQKRLEGLLAAESQRNAQLMTEGENLLKKKIELEDSHSKLSSKCQDLENEMQTRTIRYNKSRDVYESSLKDKDTKIKEQEEELKQNFDRLIELDSTKESLVIFTKQVEELSHQNNGLRAEIAQLQLQTTTEAGLTSLPVQFCSTNGRRLDNDDLWVKVQTSIETLYRERAEVLMLRNGTNEGNYSLFAFYNGVWKTIQPSDCYMIGQKPGFIVLKSRFESEKNLDINLFDKALIQETEPVIRIITSKELQEYTGSKSEEDTMMSECSIILNSDNELYPVNYELIEEINKDKKYGVTFYYLDNNLWRRASNEYIESHNYDSLLLKGDDEGFRNIDHKEIRAKLLKRKIKRQEQQKKRKRTKKDKQI